MNTRYDISQTGLRPPQSADVRTSSAVGPQAPAEASGALSAPRADQVSLRSTDLVALAQQGDGVDSAKVSALREAIANGSYQIDAQSIADRLLAFESSLEFGE